MLLRTWAPKYFVKRSTDDPVGIEPKPLFVGPVGDNIAPVAPDVGDQRGDAVGDRLNGCAHYFSSYDAAARRPVNIRCTACTRRSGSIGLAMW